MELYSVQLSENLGIFPSTKIQSFGLGLSLKRGTFSLSKLEVSTKAAYDETRSLQSQLFFKKYIIPLSVKQTLFKKDDATKNEFIKLFMQKYIVVPHIARLRSK